MEASKRDVSPVTAEEFSRAFTAVAPLIREEWPGLDASALEATGGDMERVTSLVAAHTDRTKALVRRQLAELYELGARETGASRKSHVRSAAAKAGVPDLAELIEAVQRLEALATEQARKVSAEVLPRAEVKVKENLWVSLLISLGLGMILGLWMAAGRRRGRDG